MFVLLRKLLGFTGTFRAVCMIRGPRTTFADQGAYEHGHLFSNYKKNILVWNHSYSRDWLSNFASFKGLNKGAAIYVESTTTVHNLLFYVRTLWLNNLTATFLLVSCSCKIQKLLLFVHLQG